MNNWKDFDLEEFGYDLFSFMKLDVAYIDDEEHILCAFCESPVDEDWQCMCDGQMTHLISMFVDMAVFEVGSMLFSNTRFTKPQREMIRKLVRSWNEIRGHLTTEDFELDVEKFK